MFSLFNVHLLIFIRFQNKLKRSIYEKFTGVFVFCFSLC